MVHKCSERQKRGTQEEIRKRKQKNWKQIYSRSLSRKKQFIISQPWNKPCLMYFCNSFCKTKHNLLLKFIFKIFSVISSYLPLSSQTLLKYLKASYVFDKSGERCQNQLVWTFCNLGPDLVFIGHLVRRWPRGTSRTRLPEEWRLWLRHFS